MAELEDIIASCARTETSLTDLKDRLYDRDGDIINIRKQLALQNGVDRTIIPRVAKLETKVKIILWVLGSVVGGGGAISGILAQVGVL